MVDMSLSGGITVRAGGDSGAAAAAAGAGGSSSRGTADPNVDQAAYISSNPAKNMITVENLLGNTNVVAFLHVLSVTEGNVNYNSINGGATTSNLTHFPYSATGSSAAGAYQIVESNYKNLSADLGLYDWSPHTQDAMAVLLMYGDGAAQALAKGDIQTAIFDASKDWSSIPIGPGSLDHTRATGQSFTHYQDVINLYHSFGGH